MKFVSKRLVGLCTAGAVIVAMSVPTTAASRINAGISDIFTSNIENGSKVNAGVSSALASYIDVSSARATISTGRMPRRLPLWARPFADIRILALPMSRAI